MSVVQTDTIQQKKGQSNKILAAHLFFQNTALSLIKQAAVKEAVCPSAAPGVPRNGTSQGVGFFPPSQSVYEWCWCYSI